MQWQLDQWKKLRGIFTVDGTGHLSSAVGYASLGFQHMREQAPGELPVPLDIVVVFMTICSPYCVLKIVVPDPQKRCHANLEKESHR